MICTPYHTLLGQRSRNTRPNMYHSLDKKCLQDFWLETWNEETTLGEIRVNGTLMLRDTDSENVEWINLAHIGILLLVFLNTGASVPLSNTRNTMQQTRLVYGLYSNYTFRLVSVIFREFVHRI